MRRRSIYRDQRNETTDRGGARVAYATPANGEKAKAVQGIIPQSNILLATGAAILLMNSTRKGGLLLKKATAAATISGGGSPFLAFRSSQLDDLYFWMTIPATISSMGLSGGI
jgi:hypothetical protein